MYIAMNRFKVAIGSEETFEDVWKNRDSRLSDMDGFVEFRLLRGKTHTDDGYTLFSSHTLWETEQNFIDWTKSENFRAAHKNAGERKTIYLGPPQFEGFNTVEGV